MSISLCYFFLYTCIHVSTLNRTSLIYCVSGVTLSSICRVFVRIKISRYDVCVSSLNWKKLEVKRCGYFTSLTKFGFLTYLENLLKTTKLALETFLDTSLFTHQKQYLQWLIFKGEKSKGVKFLSKLNKIAKKTFVIKCNVPISAWKG